MSDQEFTFERAKRLRKAYKVAKAQNKDAFIFEGGEWATAYAFYVLTHLSNVFGDKSLTQGINR